MTRPWPRSSRRRRVSVWLGALATVIASVAILPSRSAASDSGLHRAELIERLASAYPSTVEVGPAGQLIVSGREVPVAEARTVGSVQNRMGIATMGDQFSIPYPRGCPLRTPANDEDPGRLRNEPFFRAMYGGSRTDVARTLAPVKWFGSTLQATTTNNVDQRLRAVAGELGQRPEVARYLSKPGGGFTWRKIAGESVLSMHSFGIAFDINVAFSDYWRWSGGVKEYRNRIPCEIAEVFERHGFIWGAKWFHFDTMHFEYRPELLA